MNSTDLLSFSNVLDDEIADSQESQPLSLSPEDCQIDTQVANIPENEALCVPRPAKGTGQHGHFRSVDEIDIKYRSVFSYPYFNFVQSNVIEDALYSDKSMVVCAPTGSGKTVVFEMAIVQLLMEMEDTHYTDDFKIIYMAPVKALCTERLTEWYPKFTKLGLLCIEVTGDTDVDFSQLKPYRIIITTPEKWDMVTRRWREHRQLVEVIKLFLIDEVHILNDEARGPVLEAVVSRMKTIESSAQSAHRIEQLKNQYEGTEATNKVSPRIRFIAVSATVSNPEDVATWLGTPDKPAVYHKFGDESRPVKLKRVVEGYPCPEGTSIFKFDIVLNYKLWPVIQKYHNGKPTLIFCNTRKSVTLTAETLSRELTITFSPEQKAKLTALASTIKNKKLQALVLSGVGCHHAGLLFEERINIEMAFRNRDLPILITTTTLAMGVNLPAHLVIIKNTQQYVNGAYQEYSISTILQMVGRAGRPQFDTEATAVIMTRFCDKARYQALVGGSEPLQSYLHKRLAENLNSEAALGTVNDVAQCVQWLRSTFLCVRAARDPKRYLGLHQSPPQQLISKKIEELCVKAMNGLASSGLITMDEASCIESTEAGRLMSVFYLDLETMKHIMKISGAETLDRLLWVVCESHELADMHLRMDERRCLNALNRNNTAATIRYPMKGKISSRQMKLNCIIQAILGCLNIPDPSLNQEAMKIMRIADRVCKCLVAYVTRPALISQQPKFYTTILNALILAKCIASHLWENSPFVSKQLKGIGPTFSTLLATAGKVNFMLLEESHPRDLERIMNKGPPAGNVLRKQISLLPKYQLTMTPIDEQSVTVQLVLLNKNFLDENIENLTAGAGHKTFLIVGDSENNLLLLTSFRDKELISIYDGTIVHQITRKFSFEHKMFAHCVSSSFVGIDAECEYSFKSLESVSSVTPTDFQIKAAKKQTTITDTFKERKRKNAPEKDITQSKEKKKRCNAMIENFRDLKESFKKSSEELKKELNKSPVISNKILQKLTQPEKNEIYPDITSSNENENSKQLSSNIGINISSMPNNNTEIIDSDEYEDDDKFNDFLNKIESEISTRNLNTDLPRVDFGSTSNKQNVQSSFFIDPSSNKVIQRKNNPVMNSYIKNCNTKKRTQTKVKSNYNFIQLLQKNVDLSDEEEPVPSKNCDFSDTIKSQISKYLENTKICSNLPEKAITKLLLQEHDSDDDSTKTIKKNKDIPNLITQMKESVPNTEARQHNLHSQIKDNEQNGLKENNVTNKNDKVQIPMANINNFDTDITIDNNDNDGVTKNIGSYDDLDLDTNYHKKAVLLQEVSSVYKSCNNDDINNIKQNDSMTQNNQKAYNDNKSLLPERNDNYSTQLTTKKYIFYDTKEANALKYSTTTIPLPRTQTQSLVIPEKPEGQIFCKESNTMDAINDINEKPKHSRLTADFNLGPNQFLTSGNYSNKSNVKNEDINVRKYSYSSTKTDVISKVADVKVIRKTKIDLNITEIISRENTSNDEPQLIDTNDEELFKTENMRMNCLPPTFESRPRNDVIQYATSDQKTDSVHNEKMNTDIKYMFAAKNYEQIVTPQKILTTSAPQFNEPYNLVRQNKNTDLKCFLGEKQYSHTLTSRKIFIPPPPQFYQRCNQMEQNDNMDSKRKTAKKNYSLNYTSGPIITPTMLRYDQCKQKEQHALMADNQALVENKNTVASIAHTFTPQTESDEHCDKIEQTAYQTDNQVVDKEEMDTKKENPNKINLSTQKDDNLLKNILEKYREVLRNPGSFSQTISQSKLDKDLSTSVPEKPRRPFKITEINNLNTVLPHTLIGEIPELDNFTAKITETSNREAVTANSFAKHKMAFHESESLGMTNRYYQNPSDPIETSNNFIISTENPRVTDYENIANILQEFPEVNSPPLTADDELESEQTEVDFNIDQSMFNPKTLLQCLGNDETDYIVPPPPEFCDEENEDSSDNNESTIPRDCYEPMNWDFNESDETKQSVFKDESHLELTPRKEIETLTLSENDGSYKSLSPSNFNNERSFTMMHSSANVRSSQFQSPSLTSIKKNLGMFKYCRKNKLRPKM